MSRTARHLAAFVVFLVVSGAAGLAGNLAQGEDVAADYRALDLPWWAPPSAAFGIVWPVLYVLIALAAWRVWRAAGLTRGRAAMVLWGLQLVLNAVWPGVFFGMAMVGPAIAVITVLVVVVVATMAAFAEHDRVAATLLAPYLGWLLYATALNVAVGWLN
jgi:translocator protein